MARPRSVERRLSVLDTLDGALFAFAGLAAIWLAYLLLVAGFKPGWPLLLLAGFWIVFSYLMLPRLHRILTLVYVPGYFIGRTRTSDGLLGDPVNLALRGSESQVHETMRRAGWTQADDLSLTTGRRIVTSTLRRRSYPEAPVSPLHLFDRQQDFAYQQEVAGNPAKRHHVRFWRCPEGWMLPGGYAVDWLAAATYDRSVGLSLFTFQITHKIEADTDVERDYLLSTLRSSNAGIGVTTIRNFSTGYHARNGGGDRISTDGDLPIIDTRAVVAPNSPNLDASDSRDRRPAQTIFGAGVAILRGLGFLAFAAVLLLNTDQVAITVTGTNPQTVLGIVLGVVVVAAAFDMGLGLAVLAGRNWARILLMLSSVVGIVVAFVAHEWGTLPITAFGNLPTVTTSILVLLALSSHRARDYAARGHPVPKRIAGRPRDRAAV